MKNHIAYNEIVKTLMLSPIMLANDESITFKLTIQKNSTENYSVNLWRLEFLKVLPSFNEDGFQSDEEIFVLDKHSVPDIESISEASLDKAISSAIKLIEERFLV